MYQASEAYIEQMMHHGTRRRITGTIGNVAFTNEDIVRGSFSVSNRATEESSTKIGGVYLGQIEMTFVPSFLSKITREEYQGQELEVSIGLWVPDEEDEIDGGDWEDIPVGVYTLQAPKISKRGISVTGYDHMKKLDKAFNIDQTTARPYEYLQYISENCGVDLGNEQEDIEAMANGTELLPLERGDNVKTYRDFLYWLAQALGGFATMNRAGELEIRTFGTETDIEFDEMHRDTDVVFSGYETKWTGIYITDTREQKAVYYGLEIDDGLTMNLGANPLLQMGTGEAVDRRRRAVLNSIAQIRYTPFYCNSARDPIFDLGDEIPFTGGLSGDSTGCVMAFTYRQDGFTFEGYGDDPALTNAQTKQDKNISGLLKSTTENEVTFYTYANGTDISIEPEVETTIAALQFTPAQTTTVKIMHEFIFDMLADLEQENGYEIRYYLDDELLPYKPYESLSALKISTDIPDEPEEEQEEEPTTTTYDADIDPVELSITRDFYYIIKDVAPNERHTWQVKIITHGIEETTIQRDHAHVTIEGQRLYSDKYFNGYIEVKEELEIIPLGNLELVAISDSITVNLQAIATNTASDDISLVAIGNLTADLSNISETVDIFMQNLKLASEADETLETEDGLKFLTE